MAKLRIEGGNSDGMIFELKSVLDADDVVIEHPDGMFYWITTDDMVWHEYF